MYCTKTDPELDCNGKNNELYYAVHFTRIIIASKKGVRENRTLHKTGRQTLNSLVIQMILIVWYKLVLFSTTFPNKDFNIQKRIFCLSQIRLHINSSVSVLSFSSHSSCDSALYLNQQLRPQPLGALPHQVKSRKQL